MCLPPDDPTFRFTLSVLLILLVRRPLLISLSKLLLITPQSNLLLFHLDRQIGWIEKKRETGGEWEKKGAGGSAGPPPFPLCSTCARIPSGIIIKKVHQCSLCSSNYAKGGYSSNYGREFIYEKKKKMYRLQLDLVQLPGRGRSLPALLCYIFVKGFGKSKQVKSIFYSCMQIHLQGLLSVFKMPTNLPS